MLPHEVLGVGPRASRQEIKQAFRQKCLQEHPDLAPEKDRAAAEVRFREVSRAYAQLTGRAHLRDWSAGQSHQRAAQYAQQVARGQRRPSNVGFALLLAIPLGITGFLVGRQYPALKAEWGRPHGLLNPPVNPYLKESALPRQHSHWGARGPPPGPRPPQKQPEGGGAEGAARPEPQA